MNDLQHTNPIRVAIVDDEHLVRLGIRSYLDGSNGQYEVVNVYAEGNSALEALRREHAGGHPVDGLITDIRMPVMDGIDLTMRCKAEALVSWVIVLSCHNEFELVRRAFTSGADEYVLKHEVQQDELMEVLDRVSMSFSIVNRLSREVDWAEDSKKRVGTDQFGVWAERALSLDQSLPVIVSAYRFCHEYTLHARVVPWEPDAMALDREITEAGSEMGPAVHVPMDRGGLVVFQLRSVDEAVPERRVRRACEAIMNRVRRYWNREMQFMIEPTQRKLADIDHAAQRAALDAVWEQGIYFSGDSVIVHERETSGSVAAPELPYLHLGDRDTPAAWDNAVSTYLETARSAGIPASHLYLSLSGALHQIDRDLVHTIGKTLHDVVIESPDSPTAERGSAGSLVQQLESIDSVDVLKQWLHMVFTRVDDALHRESVRVSRVGRILSYLDDHYTHPLDLDALATRFSISKAHLCSRVRKETGKTLSQHINERRIAQARALLRTTSMSAKEVCFAVGYDNPNYFSRVFRAVSGESITTFRNAVNQ
mgnify:CR=1 FL=1